MSNTVFLFVSPHLDDVALSCGGYIYRLTSSGERVVITTAITADVPAHTPLTRGMRWRHMVWGLDNAPFEARRREDAFSAAILGAQYMHLGLLDAIYRCDTNGNPLYPKDHLHVSVHPDDLMNYEPKIRHIFQSVLDAWDGWEICIFCPMAIGGHVDHILVRSAIESVSNSWRIVYYEDFPYVAKIGDIKPEYKSSVNNWQSVTLDLAPDEIETRVSAVACYASQIPILFPSKQQHWQNRIMFHFPMIGRFLNRSTDLNTSRQRIALSLRSYIDRVGGERFWFQGSSHGDKEDFIVVKS